MSTACMMQSTVCSMLQPDALLALPLMAYIYHGSHGCTPIEVYMWRCDTHCVCPATGTATGSTPSTTPAGVLYSGSNAGATYYYDLRTRCPQDASGYAENNGYPACTSWAPGPNQRTLAQEGSNNVVAIDMNHLAANRASLCGKKVLVYKNGVQVAAPDGGDFFVWDGCQACIGGGKIDFSVSGARKVDAGACTVGVIPGVTYQVVNQQVRQFVA
jgi:hypothetical protein